MSQMLEPDLSVVDLRSYFVRKRNALLVRGRFSPLYLDYYLHLMQHGIQHAEPLDQMLKDTLAALALHLCSRPQDESCAWTIHVKKPQLANRCRWLSSMTLRSRAAAFNSLTAPLILISRRN